ncbi:MAG: cytochrome c oxidase subunit 3 [Isosphaeraceae bacterium]
MSSALADPHAHHHADHGGDGTIVEHQFDDLPQQVESSMLGMWTFLATEVMFFAGLVVSYIIFRASYRDDFEAASHHLNVPLGAFNTIILLSSSLTMALAVRASQLGKVRNSVYFMIATMLFGCGFLCIKYIEYSTDYREGLFPGLHWDWELANKHSDHTPQPAPAGAEHGQAAAAGGDHAAATAAAAEGADWYPAVGTLNPAPSAKGMLPLLGGKPRGQSEHAKLFFIYYFFMTGLHGIHIIVGLGLIGTMAVLAWRGWLSGNGTTQIEVAGLYWHFVDIVWVYLYPALYLIDKSR